MISWKEFIERAPRIAAIFTRLNRPLRILAKATMATRGDALRAEYAFKQASRADKLQWCATGLQGFITRDRR